ncbi:DNA cytosine methyltransferase [Halopseudomonas pelagia]|uniref:DNA cytosine methyltransferase n=1 Tax=Halopseudomonas pelagia TaxID=553151 RepID=UPI0003A1EDBB|nr:DNA cytosine methyltransferase [Halopseudomonas pelagia]
MTVTQNRPIELKSNLIDERANATSGHANLSYDFGGNADAKVTHQKPKTEPEETKVRKLVSLFSGGGGLDLGLEASGFETVFATDIDYHSCQTLQNSKEFCKSKGIPFLKSASIRQADVTELTSQEVMEAAGVLKGELDLMAGGPPCQAFSVFGKRRGVNDPRGLLAYEYLRLISDIQPKAFIFENVFGLFTIDGGETFKQLCKKLEAPGKDVNYTLSVFRLNAADYGVPQFRDRIFIVGSRDGKKLSSIPKICTQSPSLVDESLGKFLPYRTVTDGLRGLPPLGEKLANHTSRKHSERIIERYKNLAFGERDSKTRINKLHPEKPSYTIIVGSDKGGGKGHVHPTEPREVSPRESARMQTFPDWWSFSGTSRHPIRQVGNAVPPLLGALVGRELMQNLFDGERRSLKQIISLLGQEHLFTGNIDDL